MYQKEGVRGLMKGNLINCASSTPFTACEFYFYELFKNNLFSQVEYHDLKLHHKFMCGGLAGLCAQVLLSPFDVIKTHYTIEQSSSKSTASKSIMLDKAVNIYQREGVRGFFKGNLISMVGIVPFIAIKQSLYDYQTNTLSSSFFTQ